MRRIFFFIVLIYTNIFSNSEWTNWAGIHTCNPAQIYFPQTLDDLRGYVMNSALMNHKIRVVGAGYSYNDIACTNGLMLNLKNLNNILYVDLEKQQVRVESGITIKELNKQLFLHGLALANQAATDEITLGGALATAAHGTGHTGTFSSFVPKLN